LNRSLLSIAGRSAAVLIGLCSFALASIWSIKLGYCDSFVQQRSIDGFNKAISILPQQSSNYVKLAIQLPISILLGRTGP
jgi:hypothetical protein